MKEAARLAEQLTRSLEGEAWHGPAVLELLEGLTAEQARAKPIADAHSIAEIVPHIAIYLVLAEAAVHGTPMPPWPFPEDWEAPHADWTAAVAHLRQAGRRLTATILTLDEAHLTAQVPGREYDFYHLLHGVVQHNLYHAGQIAILKKLIEA